MKTGVFLSSLLGLLLLSWHLQTPTLANASLQQMSAGAFRVCNVPAGANLCGPYCVSICVPPTTLGQPCLQRGNAGHAAAGTFGSCGWTLLYASTCLKAARCGGGITPAPACPAQLGNGQCPPSACAGAVVPPIFEECP
jgi:hypothetical protein